jgi:hypothetical protein
MWVDDRSQQEREFHREKSHQGEEFRERDIEEKREVAFGVDLSQN